MSYWPVLATASAMILAGISVYPYSIVLILMPVSFSHSSRYFGWALAKSETIIMVCSSLSTPIFLR